MVKSVEEEHQMHYIQLYINSFDCADCVSVCVCVCVCQVKSPLFI